MYTIPNAFKGGILVFESFARFVWSVCCVDLIIFSAKHLIFVAVWVTCLLSTRSGFYSISLAARKACVMPLIQIFSVYKLRIRRVVQVERWA